MKSKFSLIFTALTMFSALNVVAQDIITNRDGTEIEATVLKVTDSEIHYYRYETQNPLYIVDKSNVSMIKYQDGAKEVFEITQPSMPYQITSQPMQYKYTTINPNPVKKRNQFGLDLSLGAASADGYGGLGGWLGFRLLHNFNDNWGWNIINFKLGRASNSNELFISAQIMTGIHYTINKIYFDFNIGVGAIMAGDIRENNPYVNGAGLALEFGAGYYIDRKLFIGAYFNNNNYRHIYDYNVPYTDNATAFGLRLGLDF